MKKGILAAFVAALALTLTAEIYAQTNDTGNMETKERIYGSVFPPGGEAAGNVCEVFYRAGLSCAADA